MPTPNICAMFGDMPTDDAAGGGERIFEYIA